MSFTQAEGFAIFLVYGLAMTLLVWRFTRREQTSDEHLVADRKVSTFAGAFSIAVTWIWAPAVFICSQKSYQQGLAGIFWFTFPNILCFFTFAPLAVRLRRLMPAGYSMPDFIWLRYPNDRKTHFIFLVITLGYELGAIIINSLAGGLLMNYLTGINLQVAIFLVAAIALFYSIWRGLPASIITDVVQMSLILFIAFILVPWALAKAGGWTTVMNGLAGTNGSVNIFDPWIAYSFGIPATLGLISGPIADQMFYQRAMSSRYEKVVRTFIFGGLVFGIVPIVLSIFGFIAASPAITPLLGISDPQMVGVNVVYYFLPRWTLYGFAVMALCGLSSTLDSAYCAVGSLGAIDVYKKHINTNATDHQLIRVSQWSMFILGGVGTLIAMIPGIKLLWVFLIYGALASAALVPTILSLYWSRLTARGAFWGSFLSFAVGLPLSIYANFTENAHLIVVAALASAVIGLIICVVDGFTSKDRYNFSTHSYRVDGLAVTETGD